MNKCQVFACVPQKQTLKQSLLGESLTRVLSQGAEVRTKEGRKEPAPGYTLNSITIMGKRVFASVRSSEKSYNLCRLSICERKGQRPCTYSHLSLGKSSPHWKLTLQHFQVAHKQFLPVSHPPSVPNPAWGSFYLGLRWGAVSALEWTEIMRLAGSDVGHRW